MDEVSLRRHEAHPPSPAVQYITQILQLRIRNGHYPVGQRLPTERELATEFDVSRTIIRQSLDELGQRRLLERVNGCRPVVQVPQQAHAASGSNARRNIAIWIFGEPNDFGCYSALQGVQRALDPDRFRLVIASPCWGDLPDVIQSEARFLDLIGEDREIAGMILWYLGGEANLPVLERLRARGLPMVFIDRRPPGDALGDHVGIDNRQAAREVVRHFVACGHRRIAHITNDEPVSTVMERLEGYRDALHEAGVSYDPDLVFNATFKEPLKSRYLTIAARICAFPDPPTAIFAVNDYSAWFLIAAMRAVGVCTPDNFEIAGIDDLERWQPGPATLTTIRQPFEQMGVEAVKLLHHRFAVREEEPYQNVVLDAPLIVRQSRRHHVEPGQSLSSSQE